MIHDQRRHRHHRLRHGRRGAALLLLPVLAGCGVQQGTVGAASAVPVPSVSSPSVSSPPVSSPSATPTTASASPVSDPLCPGESRSPSAAATAATTPDAGDGPPNYADNNAFRDAFPLHGGQRCAGLAQVARITSALHPLLARGDFVPADAEARLVGLGYPADKVAAVQNGPTGVSFTVDLYPICLEGTMDRAQVQAQAHGGYPDSTGCTPHPAGH